MESPRRRGAPPPPRVMLLVDACCSGASSTRRSKWSSPRSSTRSPSRGRRARLALMSCASIQVCCGSRRRTAVQFRRSTSSLVIPRDRGATACCTRTATPRTLANACRRSSTRAARTRICPPRSRSSWPTRSTPMSSRTSSRATASAARRRRAKPGSTARQWPRTRRRFSSRALRISYRLAALSAARRRCTWRRTHRRRARRCCCRVRSCRAHRPSWGRRWRPQCRAQTFFKNYAKIGDVRCRVAIAHGTADEVVGFSNGKALHRRCADAHEPLWCPGRGHNNMDEKAVLRYFHGVLDYVEANQT